MKIIELKFTNINNLKGGPHIISFEEEPLKSSGLFGILGPTGSGKSTLLDVITLALFNRIPRFSKQISKKEISDLGSVMTHHTDYADASITYQIKNETYTSKWSISKARTGNLRDYEMHLTDATGKYADLKKSEVPIENEKIIGLNYDQFIKSIILSQGEFAKFLKATKNERGLLLEKITGANIYRDIGKKVYAIHKEKKEKLNLELKSLDEIKVKPEEEIQKIVSSNKALEKENGALTQQYTMLVNLKNIKETTRKNIDEINELLSKQKDISEQIDSYKNQSHSVSLHEKLLPIKSDLLKLKEGKQNIIVLKDQISSNNSKLINSKNEFAGSLNEMANLTKQNVTAENFKAVMTHFEDEVKDLYKDVENIKQKGIEERNRINHKLEQTITQDEKLFFQKLKDPQSAIAHIEEKQSLLKIALHQANLNSESDKSETRKKINQKREEETQINSLIRILENKNKLEEDNKRYNVEVKKEKASLKETEPYLNEIEQHLTTAKALQKSLYNEKNASIKIAKLEQLRNELITNEPCPLCGSLSHPYQEHNPDVDSSSIDLKLNETSKKINALETEKSALEKKITQHVTHLKNLEIQIKNTNTELNTLDVEINNFKSNITKTIGKDISRLKSKSAEINQEIANLDSGLEALDQMKFYQELTIGYRNLLEISHTYKNVNNKLQAKFKGDDVSKICNDIQDKFSASKRSIEDLEKDISLTTKTILSLEEEITALEIILQPKKQALSFENFNSMLSSLLNEDEYNNLKEKDDYLKSEKLKIKTQISALQKAKELNQSKDTKPNETLENVSLAISNIEISRDHINKKIGENTATLESEKSLSERRKNKEKKINKLNLQLENWSLLNQLIGDALGNNFANFAQGLTLQNLLSLANKRLKKLSDRYLLDKPKNDELQVIDLYQGNIQRSVSTLSGGETFLISLALALSLSDMASKNVPLESLFIDEGFGTLDQDTLDIALSTLEKLQSESQKTIGIISHVEALKERIDVQIHLDKNAQGYSKIRIQS